MEIAIRNEQSPKNYSHSQKYLRIYKNISYKIASYRYRKNAMINENWYSLVFKGIGVFTFEPAINRLHAVIRKTQLVLRTGIYFFFEK